MISAQQEVINERFREQEPYLSGSVHSLSLGQALLDQIRSS